MRLILSTPRTCTAEAFCHRGRKVGWAGWAPLQPLVCQAQEQAQLQLAGVGLVPGCSAWGWASWLRWPVCMWGGYPFANLVRQNVSCLLKDDMIKETKI